LGSRHVATSRRSPVTVSPPTSIPKMSPSNQTARAWARVGVRMPSASSPRLQPAAEVLVFPRLQQRVLDHRHPAAEAQVRLSEFQPYCGAAQHGRAQGQALGHQGLGGGTKGAVLEARNRGTAGEAPVATRRRSVRSFVP
jgi:hypothetical protein